jgi:hypothetical protein
VVEHLGADHSRVQDRAALGDEALADAAAHLRGLVSHVSAETDAEVRGLLLAQPGEDSREGAPDEAGGLAVELAAVEAADVVGLEDARRDCGQNFPSRLS